MHRILVSRWTLCMHVESEFFWPVIHEFYHLLVGVIVSVLFKNSYFSLLFHTSALTCFSLLWIFQCKNVISKLQRRIDKEGQQIVPLLTDLWKKIEKHGYTTASGNELSDLRRIDQQIDRLEYNGVMELAASVQHMLKGAMQFYGSSLEVTFTIFGWYIWFPFIRFNLRSTVLNCM